MLLLELSQLKLVLLSLRLLVARLRPLAGRDLGALPRGTGGHAVPGGLPIISRRPVDWQLPGLDLAQVLFQGQRLLRLARRGQPVPERLVRCVERGLLCRRRGAATLRPGRIASCRRDFRALCPSQLPRPDRRHPPGRRGRCPRIRRACPPRRRLLASLRLPSRPLPLRGLGAGLLLGLGAFQLLGLGAGLLHGRGRLVGSGRGRVGRVLPLGALRLRRIRPGRRLGELGNGLVAAVQQPRAASAARPRVIVTTATTAAAGLPGRPGPRRRGAAGRYRLRSRGLDRLDHLAIQPAARAGEGPERLLR